MASSDTSHTESRETEIIGFDRYKPSLSINTVEIAIEAGVQAVPCKK